MKRDFPDSETAYPANGISRGQSGARVRQHRRPSETDASLGRLRLLQPSCVPCLRAEFPDTSHSDQHANRSSRRP